MIVEYIRYEVEDASALIEAYEEGGWNTEPATLEELDEIAEQIKADTGAAPWCIGWESAQATGWVGTDWVEEYMLRLHGPDVYDDYTLPNFEALLRERSRIVAREELGDGPRVLFAYSAA